MAGVILAGLILGLLWTPLTSDGVFAGIDVLQQFPLHQIEPPGYRLQHNLLGDPVVQMYPSLRWNRQELWHGRLPVWNPFNGFGAPHLANYQSAVLSPFSLPFYVLDFRTALLVAAFLKLFALGQFTYLFLRRLAVAPPAALAGAVAYTFGSYHLLWLSWPHVGAAIALPAGAYCVERFLQADRRDWPARGFALLGLALALAAGLLAGHPETTFYSLVLLGFYTLGRLLLASNTWPGRLRLAVGLAGAAVLALALTAVQLLPFVEYLGQSAAFAERRQPAPGAPSGWPAFHPQLLPLQAFPYLAGSPVAAHDLAFWLPATNFLEANGHYVGLLVLFLAGVGVAGLGWRREPARLLFALAGLGWLAYAYNLVGIGEIVGRLPLVSVAASNRSQEVWLFCVAVLAAYGVNDLLARLARLAWRRTDLLAAAGLLVWGGLLLGGGWYGAGTLGAWGPSLPDQPLASATGQAFLHGHLLSLSALFVAGWLLAVLVVALPPTRRPGPVARLVGAVLVGLVFLPTGGVWRDLNPTIPARLVYPVTPALAAISQATGGAPTLWLNGAALPANANLWYELPSLSNYDAMNVGRYEALHGRLIRQEHPATEHGARVEHLHALRLLGVQYVATDQLWPLALIGVPAAPDERGARTTPITADRPLVQRFRGEHDGLAALLIRLTAFGRTNACLLDARLDDIAADRTFAAVRLPCASIRDEQPLVLTFPPLADSAGRRYRLTLSSPDATPENAIGAVYMPRGAGSELRAGGPGSEILIGQLVFSAVSGDFGQLRPVWSDGRFALFAVPDALPAQFTVGQAQHATNGTEALALLERDGLDPARVVVLEGAPPETAGSDEAGPATLIEATPTRLRLRAERTTPGWLVVLRTFYPGWRATVNGQPTSLLPANVAFMAVPVGAGVSEVTLAYDPLSVRAGLTISGSAVLVAVTLAALLLWRRHRRADDEAR